MNITGPASAPHLQFAFHSPLPAGAHFTLTVGAVVLSDTRVLAGGRRLVVTLPPSLPAGRYPYTLARPDGTPVLRGTYTRS